MGIFDQLGAAKDMLKGMSPDQISQLMKQAQDSKAMMEDMVRKLVEAEIKRRDLVTREEVQKMLQR